MKAGAACFGNKIVGRQHNANILYFTANCGRRGNNRNLKRAHRKEAKYTGAGFYHSQRIKCWSTQKINSLPLLSLFSGRANTGARQWTAIFCCTSTSFTYFDQANLTHCSCGWSSSVLICYHYSALVMSWIVHIVDITMVVIIQVVI